MPTFYTRDGDEGFTGLLGDSRVEKYELRIEALGDLDEASAAIGLARAQVHSPETRAALLKIQRGLYNVMAEVASTPENAEKFRIITTKHVAAIEGMIEKVTQHVTIPQEFILPGDSVAGAALDLARTVVRRAERRATELIHEGHSNNSEIIGYLNRVSSLLFVLELEENRCAGQENPTLAKE
jgi:cob(I)alamin adenosyltransferase